MYPYTTTIPFQGGQNGQPAQLAILQPIVVQPAPQPLQQAMPAQPGAFQAALEHAPLDASLFTREGSQVQVQAPVSEDMQEPGAPRQASQVVIHSPAKAGGRVEGKQQQAPATPQPPKTPVDMAAASTTQTTTTRTTSSGCCDCDDPATQYILWHDDGSCAAVINACATGVLRSCQALARLPGAARDCLPSSQALHNGCDSLVSAGARGCEGFGRCLVGGLDLCKDIITCPCTVCGEICKACCDGLGRVDCNCCTGCDCCCCCCDGNGGGCGDCDGDCDC